MKINKLHKIMPLVHGYLLILPSILLVPGWAGQLAIIIIRQLISGAFEHSMLHVWEIYALENAVLYIAVYVPYKP